MCICACVMCWGRIYGSEFQAEEQCEFVCINLLSCFRGADFGGTDRIGDFTMVLFQLSATS